MKKSIVLIFILLNISRFSLSHAIIWNESIDNALDSSLRFKISDSLIYIPVERSADNLNSYALVAGGSKGIGYAIAEALAKRKFNLILIARHIDALNIAKEKLESAYYIHVEVLVHDLSKEESAEEIARWCTERNIQLKVLCNVAGLGGVNDYLSIPLDTVRYMVRLNVESCMALSYTLLPLLEKNAPSYILNVASMAGLAPIPVKNVYSATKSAVVFFSYSLRYQLKKKKIGVSCLCPGPVFTKPSIEKDTRDKLGWFGVKMTVPQKKVGEVAVRKTLRKKMIIVPGVLPGVVSVFLRILPKRILVAIYSKV
jgi:short-subunit dehydrogenase